MPTPSSSERQDSDRPVVQGDAGQHPARDAHHHGAAGGGSPVRYRPEAIDDLIFAESHYVAAISPVRGEATGMEGVSGQRSTGTARAPDGDRQRGRSDRLRMERALIAAACSRCR